MKSKMDATVPLWARVPIGGFGERLESIGRIMSLSRNGIDAIHQKPEILEFIIRQTEVPPAKAALARRTAEDQSQMAKVEIEADFPILHELATVATWSSLEAFVRSYCANWVRNVPSAREIMAIQDLKVRLGDYEALDDTDRALWIIDQLDSGFKGPLKCGVNRFESLLKLFKLDGKVDRKIKERIWDLNHVRNVIVHRCGIADVKFINACPHWKIKSGERVRVTAEVWHGYLSAVTNYGIEISQRVREHFGLKRLQRP